MSKQLNKSLSLNSPGPTENAGGAFFLRMGFTQKVSLADRAFTTSGLGGAGEGVDLSGVPPLTMQTLSLTSTSATWLLGDGKTNYNYFQIAWNTSDTSVSNVEFGYIRNSSPAGATSFTLTYTRLATLGTSSSTTNQINSDDGTIDFTPSAGMIYAFVVYNNSGSALNRPNGMATIYANPNLT